MKQIILVCTLLISSIVFSQTGPAITLNNDLMNCQVEFKLYQINTTTMDCTSLIVTNHALGVSTCCYTVSPYPGHAFVKVDVQKGGGTPSCFITTIEPNDSPCDTITIEEHEHFEQCCSSSIAGGTSIKWSGGMASPVITVQND